MKSNKQLMGIIEVLEAALRESKTLSQFAINASSSKEDIQYKAEHVLSIINETESSYKLG